MQIANSHKMSKYCLQTRNFRDFYIYGMFFLCALVVIDLLIQHGIQINAKFKKIDQNKIGNKKKT